MAKLRETLSLRNPATQRTLLVGLAFVAGFIVLGIISIQVWEYSNSVAFVPMPAITYIRKNRPLFRTRITLA